MKDKRVLRCGCSRVNGRIRNYDAWPRQGRYVKRRERRLWDYTNRRMFCLHQTARLAVEAEEAEEA